MEQQQWRCSRCPRASSAAAPSWTPVLRHEQSTHCPRQCCVSDTSLGALHPWSHSGPLVTPHIFSTDCLPWLPASTSNHQFILPPQPPSDTPLNSFSIASPSLSAYQSLYFTFFIALILCHKIIQFRYLNLLFIIRLLPLKHLLLHAHDWEQHRTTEIYCKPWLGSCVNSPIAIFLEKREAGKLILQNVFYLAQYIQTLFPPVCIKHKNY